VFDSLRVVAPALDAFAPQLVLVSSGFDASFFDTLAQQMCTSEDYRWAFEEKTVERRATAAGGAQFPQLMIGVVRSSKGADVQQ
jgi:acetoin utilization deacetylase AcuC-like enzyme